MNNNEHLSFYYNMPLSRDGCEEMYVRYHRFETAGGTADFGTYFNGISIAKLLRYTDISSLRISFCVFGRVKADIAVRSQDNTQTVIFSEEKSGSFDIDIRLCDIPEDSVYLYPVLTALCDGVQIISASVYLCGISHKEPSAAIVMCTFRREEYVRRNAEYITAESEKYSLPIKIIIVDNGRTLSEADLPDSVTLIPNDNTGGSGGFSEGMKAASAMGGFDRLIIMDDDITLDIISIQKLIGFLRFIKPQYADISVSGSMLFSDMPCIQFEAGGCFDRHGVQKGYGYSFDLSLPDKVTENEQEHNINYGGWWFMCMPMRYVDEGNLPLPFFIKYDDVEYALRCKLRIITLNGVSVWHERFDNKFNSSAVYYNMRNYLHLCSIHCDDADVAKAVRIRLVEHLCRQQYNMAQAVLMGYEDYLKGIDYLKSISPSENHAKVSKLNYRFLSEQEIIRVSGVNELSEGIKISENTVRRKSMRLSFYSALLPSFLCRKNAVVPTTDDRKEMYYKVGTAVHYNFRTHNGYITRHSMRAVMKYLTRRRK